MGTIKHIITLRLNHYIHYPLKLLDFDQTISREFVRIYPHVTGTLNSPVPLTFCFI